MKKLKVMFSLMAALVAAGMMTACSSSDPDPVPPVDKTPTISVVSPASGPAAGGTAVTITGTYLTGTHAVAFGGALATGVTVVNDTTVTCVTPAHAGGAVDVILATAGGSVTKAGGYSYVVPPTPVNAGRWAGAGIQFFVGAGGTSITSAGSSLSFPAAGGGGPCAIILGPFQTSCGAATTYIGASIPIRNMAFSLAGGGISFRGNFASVTKGGGMWSFSDARCGSAGGSWAANWAGARSVLGGESSAAGSDSVPVFDDQTGEQIGLTVYER